jgi:hypothetical protein
METVEDSGQRWDQTHSIGPSLRSRATSTRQASLTRTTTTPALYFITIHIRSFVVVLDEQTLENKWLILSSPMMALGKNIWHRCLD